MLEVKLWVCNRRIYAKALDIEIVPTRRKTPLTFRAALMAFCTMFCCAATIGSANASSPAPKKFRISVDKPALTGMPIWLRAAQSGLRPTHYPFSQDPCEFGNNRIELRLNNNPVPLRRAANRQSIPSTFIDPNEGDTRFSSKTVALDALPLHLLFSFDRPGVYSVRWSRLHISSFDTEKPKEVLVAQSDWLSFRVADSTEQQRKAWLLKQLASAPIDESLLVGRYLPSILAAAPDQKVLPVLIQQIYAYAHRDGNGAVPDEGAVGYYACDALSLFRDEDVRKAIVNAIKERGPNELIAFYLSWYRHMFKPDREQLVNATLPYLQSKNDIQVADALMTLYYVTQGDKCGRSECDSIKAKADQAVLAISPRLIQSRKTHALALYLGKIPGDKASALLWQIVGQSATQDQNAFSACGPEQALICLTWRGNKEDIPKLGNMLVKFKPSKDLQNSSLLSSLTYHFMRAYGARAVPYYRRAVSESPYPAVRQACESALRGRKNQPN